MNNLVSDEDELKRSFAYRRFEFKKKKTKKPQQSLAK